MDLVPFNRLIQERCGLVFEDPRRSVLLAEAIGERMSSRGMGSPAGYLDLLRQDAQEFSSLVNLLTVNETYFFREPAHLKILSGHLAPEILRRSGTGKVRILSAGCSTGEEPYSVAMALMERYGAQTKLLFSIVGIDIDSNAIQSAKAGIFGRYSFRSIDPQLMERYFEKISDYRYRIKKFVKEMVEFQNTNLLNDSCVEAIDLVDVILYRNVSIYFESEIQKRVFTNLSRILNNKGYMILSSTETFAHDIDILKLVEMDRAFLYQKNSERHIHNTRENRTKKLEPSHEKKEIPRHSLRPSIGGETVSPGSKVGAREKESPEGLLHHALALAKRKNYPEALKVIDRLIAEEPSLAQAYAFKGNILLHLRQTAEAERACMKALERDPLCLEPYLLLGMIARMNQEEETALRRLKEARYIRPACWLAHYYLAEIYQARGEPQESSREYEITRRLLEKGGFAESGLSLFLLSISAEQMIHLCRDRIQRISQGREG